MKLKRSALALRLVHALLLVYFGACVLLIYYAAWHATFNTYVMIAAISVCIEGLAVFVLNSGDCPLIHIQRKVGDDKAFFSLFLPERLAKLTLPIVGIITTVGLLALLIRLGYR